MTPADDDTLTPDHNWIGVQTNTGEKKGKVCSDFVELSEKRSKQLVVTIIAG